MDQTIPSSTAAPGGSMGYHADNHFQQQYQYGQHQHHYEQENHSDHRQGLHCRQRNRFSHATRTNSVANSDGKSSTKHSMLEERIRNLDVFYSKVERDMKVSTRSGGLLTLVGYGLVTILSLAEIGSWISSNRETAEHVTVHTRMDKLLHVTCNVTFPSLPCDEIISESIDIGGDSTPLDPFIKRRSLPPDGSDDGPKTGDAARKGSIAGGCNLSGNISVNRVGGIFYFHVDAGDETSWVTGKQLHKHSTTAVGDMNASHVVHEFTFTPHDEGSSPPSEVWSRKKRTGWKKSGLNNVSKITGRGQGTGLFTYFLQLVPTTYKGEGMLNSMGVDPLWLSGQTGERGRNADEIPALDAIRVFFTEKFEPYMRQSLDGDEDEEDVALTAMPASLEDEAKNVEGTHPDGVSKKVKGRDEHHHAHQRPAEVVVPGLYLSYELYPFTVEVTRNELPWTHLLIRLMATVGGVFTIMGWADSALHAKEIRHKRGRDAY